MSIDTKVTRVVPEAPVSVEMGALPEAVIQHYLTIGSVLSVRYGAQQAIAQYQIRGAIPVFRDEVPDEVHRAMLKAGWRHEKTDDTYRLGDCALYVMPLAQREANRDEAELDWLRLDDDETWRAEMEERERKLRGDLGGNRPVSLGYTHLGRASDAVVRARPGD